MINIKLYDSQTCRQNLHLIASSIGVIFVFIRCNISLFCSESNKYYFLLFYQYVQFRFFCQP